jgi:oligogalacturonide lyase
MSATRRWTRRGFLHTGVALAASGAQFVTAKRAQFESDWGRYPDGATELDVYRLTSPSYSSFLSAQYGRPFSRRGNFLLFSCDRTSTQQVHRMDLKTGKTEQLTEAPALDAASIHLLPDERAFCCFDGNSLVHVPLGSLRAREVYRIPQEWKKAPGLSLTPDGLSAVIPETNGTRWRLQLVGLAKGQVSTILETTRPLEYPMVNPRRAQVLCRERDEALWVAPLAGGPARRLRLAEGGIGPAGWSPGGQTVLYLLKPLDPALLHAVCEHSPDENRDKLIARTSQFASFGWNGNASVFVGASQNRASPHVLLLLRATRRELTLCEHRAASAASVAPVFSPDSQRVFFQSDRHGKPALYMLNVERFVERVTSEASEG